MSASARLPYSSRRRIEGLVALVIVQLCFGLFPVLVKLVANPEEGGDGFAPRAIAFWRICVGAAVLTALALARHRAEFRLPAGDLLRLALCAFFGIVANQWLALEGVVRTHALTGGVLMTLIPVFTYGVAILARQESVSGRRALGIAVALAGALGLLVSQARTEPSAAAEAPLLGSLLIVINCLSYAIYLVLARSLLLRLPPLVVMAWTFLLALASLPILGWGVEVWPAQPAPSALRAFALLLLLPTVLGYLLNAWALARVSASTTAVFVYLQPLVAGASAMVWLGERPGVATLLASLVLFVGIGLVVWRRAQVAPLATTTDAPDVTDVTG